MAALVVSTPLTSLAELRRALKAPGIGQSVFQNAAPCPSVASAKTEEACDTISVHVRGLAGSTVLGPDHLHSSTLVADLQNRIADIVEEAPFSIRLVHGATELNPANTLAEEGLPGRVDLVLVICKDRVEIAEALFAKAHGRLHVPEGTSVHAPFSGQMVAFYEASVVRLYDEWVTTWERRHIKAGRSAGARGKDDPGSDSEYEDVERSAWEPREEVVERRSVIAPRVLLDDGSGQHALLAPRDLQAWARENAELVHSQTEAREFNVGAAVQALIAHERERGLRREERCIGIGEECEVVGEACITETEGLVLREPTRPSELLHRVDSQGLLPTQATATASTGRRRERLSSLQNKAFVGTVLRGGQQSLAQVKLRRAALWRVGKWICCMLAHALAAWVFRRMRRRQMARQMLVASSKAPQ